MGVEGQAAYSKVVVIGYGKIAGKVLRYVADRSIEYGYHVIYIEHEIYPFNQAAKYAASQGILSYQISEKKDLTEFFLSMEEPVLVVSAGNNYIFPEAFLSGRNVTVMNFHNALLPKYPGRNAPSWAIYEGESETGITWHYITQEIDAGEIIIQKRCWIGADVKAYQLADMLMELAYESFVECFEKVLINTAKAVPQELKNNRRVYGAAEVPGNAHFTDADEPDYIYRLLRAVDYGKNRIFPSVTATLEGKEVIIKRYQKLHGNALENENGSSCFLMPYEDGALALQYSDAVWMSGIKGKNSL